MNTVNLVQQHSASHANIVKAEECRNRTARQLSCLFRDKVKECMQVIEKSKEAMYDCGAYARLLLQAEQAFYSLEPIVGRLLLKSKEPCPSKTQKMGELQQLLVHMRHQHPEGKGLLLPSDWQRLQSLNEPPRELTRSFGDILYDLPQVSVMGLMKWFDPYRNMGGYKGISIMSNITNMWNISIEPATVIALRKKEEQKKEELKANSPPEQAESSYFGWLSQTASSLYRFVIPSETLEIEQSKRHLQEINDRFSQANSENNWGFRACQVLSSKQLIELQVKQESAVDADLIILYYKPTTL